MSTHLSILELPSLSLFPLLKGKSCIISRYLYILPLNYNIFSSKFNHALKKKKRKKLNFKLSLEEPAAVITYQIFNILCKL